MCKLGDKAYNKYEKEIEEDIEKEESLVTKIRDLVKERKKQRAQHQRKMPPAKRRKMDKNELEPSHILQGGEKTGHYPCSPCE